MRLIELEPRWLSYGGNPNAVLLFRCPCCREMWLTCTAVALATRDQFEILRTQFPGNGGQVVTCKMLAWQMAGVPDFDSLTVTPSIDASASGHWHGSISNGDAP